MFSYKIQKRSGEFRIYTTKTISPAHYLLFVFGWLFVIMTLGLGYLILIFVEAVSEDHVSDILLFPKVDWDWVISHSSLDEAVEWMEEHKEEQKEVYCL